MVRGVILMAPIVRIVMRYIAGYLIASGYLSEADKSLFVDPELIGFIVMLLTEGYYIAARRFGWQK